MSARRLRRARPQSLRARGRQACRARASRPPPGHPAVVAAGASGLLARQASALWSACAGAALKAGKYDETRKALSLNKSRQTLCVLPRVTSYKALQTEKQLQAKRTARTARAGTPAAGACLPRPPPAPPGPRAPCGARLRARPAARPSRPGPPAARPAACAQTTARRKAPSGWSARRPARWPAAASCRSAGARARAPVARPAGSDPTQPPALSQQGFTSTDHTRLRRRRAAASEPTLQYKGAHADHCAQVTSILDAKHTMTAAPPVLPAA